MNKAAWTAIAGGEVANAIMNQTRIQKGRNQAYVPPEAKEGAQVQAAGAMAYFESMRKKNREAKAASTAVIFGGTLARTRKYVQLYCHPKLIPPEQEELTQTA